MVGSRRRWLGTRCCLQLTHDDDEELTTIRYIIDSWLKGREEEHDDDGEDDDARRPRYSNHKMKEIIIRFCLGMANMQVH